MEMKEFHIIDQQLGSLASPSDSSTKKDEIAHAITGAIEANDDNSLKKILQQVHYADLADYINFANYDQKQKILTLLQNKLNPDILLEFEIDILLSVLKILGNKTFATLTGKLPTVEILQILEEFKEEDRDGIIPYLPVKKQSIVKHALSYPKNCAGLLMVRKYAVVKSSQTVGNVLAYLSGNDNLPEDYDEIFILDARDHPIGSVHIS